MDHAVSLLPTLRLWRVVGPSYDQIRATTHGGDDGDGDKVLLFQALVLNKQVRMRITSDTILKG